MGIAAGDFTGLAQKLAALAAPPLGPLPCREGKKFKPRATLNFLNFVPPRTVASANSPP